jgi:hypothetical protein
MSACLASSQPAGAGVSGSSVSVCSVSMGSVGGVGGVSARGGATMSLLGSLLGLDDLLIEVLHAPISLSNHL